MDAGGAPLYHLLLRRCQNLNTDVAVVCVSMIDDGWWCLIVPSTVEKVLDFGYRCSYCIICFMNKYIQIS